MLGRQADGRVAIAPLERGGLPVRSPGLFGFIARKSIECGYGATAGRLGAQHTEAQYAFVAFQAVIAIEIGDPHGERSGTHERVQRLVEIETRGVLDLMREIAPERAFARGGIVRSADAGQEKQPGIVERECRDDYEAGGLKEFVPIGGSVLDARRLAILV